MNEVTNEQRSTLNPRRISSNPKRKALALGSIHSTLDHKTNMSKLAITVDALSKKYEIGLLRRRHDTFRDQVAAGVKSLFLFHRNGVSADNEKILWALKNVSFEVKHGEVVGIIGRNGAGKSTLLKILSRITEPTGGYAKIDGRLGALLEVGSGFHGELTGRENVYLIGAVLGMRKAEIKRKFDQIVDFSGVERFIDTPVKRYSSGMYVRLAFAVAAHLEPDILIVDEVLAVGDLAFQKKCLGKMSEVASQGRTVLFVSHHMPSVLSLCPTAILLEGGEIAFRGPSSVVIERYLNANIQNSAEKIWRPQDLPSTCGPFRPIALRVCNGSGTATDLVRSSQPFYVELQYEVTEPVPDLRIQFKFYTALGEQLFLTSDTDDPARHQLYPTRGPGHYISRCHIPANLLNNGLFVVGVSATIPKQKVFFFEKSGVTFTVDVTGGVGSAWIEEREGFFRPAFHWDIEPLDGMGSTCHVN
jgi:lipopolysaccharide transport system ATP-binding protein